MTDRLAQTLRAATKPQILPDIDQSPAPSLSLFPLARPLGFNSWNHFGEHPTEQIFLETAANFTSLGLRDAGYVFINSDDGWLSRNRSGAGALVPMPEQFPNGIACVADGVPDGTREGLRCVCLCAEMGPGAWGGAAG